jgi:hypothetical protein
LASIRTAVPVSVPTGDQLNIVHDQDA